MKKVFNSIIAKKNSICLCFFAFFLVLIMLENSTLGVNETLSRIIYFGKFLVFGIFFLDILYDVITKKIKINFVLIFLSIIAVETLIFSRKPHMLILMLLMVEASKYKFSTVVKTALITFIACFGFIIFLSIVGIIPNAKNYRMDGTLRYSLGFSYVTIAQTVYFFIILFRTYLKGKDVSYVELLCHAIVVSVVYYLTDSKCDFFLSIFALIVILFAKLFGEGKPPRLLYSKSFKIGVTAIPILVFFVSELALILYSFDLPIMNKIDALLSGRLYLTLTAWNEYGFSFFGTTHTYAPITYVDWVIVQDSSYLFLDNSIFSSLLLYGFVNLITILIGYTFLLKENLEQKNYWFVFCLVLILLQSLIEPYLIAYNYNVFVLSLGYLLNIRNHEPLEIFIKKTKFKTKRK